MGSRGLESLARRPSGRAAAAGQEAGGSGRGTYPSCCPNSRLQKAEHAVWQNSSGPLRCWAGAPAGDLGTLRAGASLLAQGAGPELFSKDFRLPGTQFISILSVKHLMSAYCMPGLVSGAYESWVQKVQLIPGEDTT